MTKVRSLTQIHFDAASLVSWANGPTDTPLALSVRVAGEGPSALIELRCVELLRLLPGRRIVCAATLDDQPVVVKWFIGAGAARYQQRELRGTQLLHAAKIRTPEVMAVWGTSAVDNETDAVAGQPEVFALVFERLVAAQPLTDELLQSSPRWTEQLWQLLADLHNAGLDHADLHFGNLLCSETQLWLIDGDAVTSAGASELGSVLSVQRFARLAAQFRTSASFTELRAQWESYCAALQWSEAVPMALVERRYRIARRRRIRHYQAKTQRTCSAFARRRSVLGTTLLDRHWLRARLSEGETRESGKADSETIIGRELLRWMDALPQRLGATPTVLKAGNTATVVEATFRGHNLIVKRYNNKSPWHRLRRLIRRDRGLNSWVFAHTLNFVGIPACRAVALLRTRWAGPTYLVMEALPGAELTPQALSLDLSSRDLSRGEINSSGEINNSLADRRADEFERVSQRLLVLLDALANEGLVHNDTKASNFMWDKRTGDMALIDLDAMVMPASRRTARNGHVRDRQRLLRNFAATPELQRRFRSLLGL